MNQLERLQLILRAKNDPKFFLSHPYFIGDFKPYPVQGATFCEFYNGGYKELDMVAGMESGKSALGSLFIARDAFDVLVREDPAKDYGLSSHSLVTLYAIARSIEQSEDTIFREVRERMKAPFFMEFAPRFRSDEITFRKHDDIQIKAGGAVSAGSLMGRNVKTNVFDEITSYDETKSQRGAWSVYHRLRKSTGRFGFDGHVIAISMTWHIHDIIMTLVRKNKNDPRTLVKEYATWEMNPNKPFDSEEMQAELHRDPGSFWRDRGIKPHLSIESFYPNPDIIRMNESRINLFDGLSLQQSTKILERIKVLPELPKTSYVFSVDPGINNCRFGLSLLHIEGDKTICDGLFRLEPQHGIELNPFLVRKLLVSVCKAFPIAYFVTDQWTYNEAITEIKNLGVQVLFKPLRKEEHDEVKNAFFDETFELCNYPPIMDEFSQMLVLDSKRIGIVRGGYIDTVDALTRGYWAVRNHLINRPYIPMAVEVI